MTNITDVINDIHLNITIFVAFKAIMRIVFRAHTHTHTHQKMDQKIMKFKCITLKHELHKTNLLV